MVEVVFFKTILIKKIKLYLYKKLTKHKNEKNSIN